MGEDVWSLVARQLYSPNANTDTDQQQGGESKGEGQGSSPGGDHGDKEAAAAAAGITTAGAAASAFSSFALCVGMPGAGKSTLLNAYLNPNNDSVPKPTVALEYMFARRARGANMPKVQHYCCRLFECATLPFCSPVRKLPTTAMVCGVTMGFLYTLCDTTVHGTMWGLSSACCCCMQSI